MPQKLDLPLLFSRQEYSNRQANTQQEMRRHGLNALLLFSQHSQYYLYGYEIIHAAVLYQAIILPAEGKPIAVVRYIDEPILRCSAFDGEIVTWEDAVDDPVGLTLTVLKKIGCLKNARLGIETRNQALYAYYYAALSEKITAEGGALIESSDLVTTLRVKKSPAEVQVMRQAGKFLDITYEAAFKAMQPGALECEVNAAALYAAYMAGADENALPLLISSGANTITSTHKTATRKPIQKGDVVLMEAGASANCYYAVGCHAVICGQSPDAEMERLYKDARRAINAGRSVLGPGVARAEVARAMLAATDEGTYTNYFLRKSYGAYGIGIGFPSMWYDNLLISLNATGILEPGNALSIFGCSRKDDDYVIVSVDPVVITENGFEDLCFLKREEMRIVGL